MVSVSSQKLRIFEAEVPGAISGWEVGPELPLEIALCPEDLPSPFTVVCIPPNDQQTSFAVFSVNGVRVRTERRLPYVLTGDTFRSGAVAWTPSSKIVQIECTLSTGETVFSTITFSCDEPANGITATTLPPTTTASTIPPTTHATTVPPTTTTVTTSTPTPTEFSTAPPSTTISTTTVTTTSTTVPTTPLAPENPVEDPEYCIYIPAKSYESKTGAWEEAEDSDSMWYKKGDESPKTDRAGLATMRYSFTPLATARYALTLDMYTSHRTEHNDVWVEISGVPFMLVSKEGTTVLGKNGLNKAYHNKDGRGRVVFTTDFDPHVFSTESLLQAGETYVLKIGGRSSKVAVFGAILFPCGSYSCAPTQEWYRSANICSY
ncbi:unnamed protein product [Agarophyton chilense]